MNLINTLFSSEIIEASGWTIIHSLWQATLIAIVLAIMLLILRKKSAQLKYFLSFTALVAVLIWSSVTFVRSYNYAAEKQAIKEKITSDPNYIKTLLAQSSSEVKLITETDSEIININTVKFRAFFQRNFNAICTIWLIGMILLMVRFMGGYIYTRRLRSYHLNKLADEWLHQIERLSAKLGIRRKVEAFLSPLAKVPMTLGTLKPIILFPVTAFTGLSSKEIEAIIAHELAHVLRNDYLFNIIQSMIDILFFYHPAVWIISSQIRAERENSCDNIAIDATGDKVAFAKALAAIQIQSLQNEHLSMAFARSRNSVLQRIKRLQKQIAMKTNFIEGLIAGGVIIFGLTLASYAFGDQSNLPKPKVEVKQDTVATAVKKTGTQKDSIRTVLETNIKKANVDQKKTDELKKVAEVALSEDDDELSEEMIEEINEGFEEADVAEIVREAMLEATSAINEASIEVGNALNEIDHEDINRDLEDAARDIEEARREMAEDMYRDMSEDDIDKEIIEASINAASAGMAVASEVIENIDINGIIHSALTGVNAALNSIGEIEHHHHRHWEECDSSNDNLYDEMKKELEKEKRILEREQQKMQGRVDDINKKIEKLDK